jgi:hypothetical protein
MKTIQVTTMPDCDICGAEGVGVYDAPTQGSSRWGNICEKCYPRFKTDTADAVGFKRVLIDPNIEKHVGKKVVAIEQSTIEEIVYDSERVVACPLCSTTKSVEPDAGYEYECEGCGATVSCSERI